jgi:hypothetical protein
MLLNRKKKMPLDLMAAAQIVRAGDTKDVMKAYGLERRTAQKLRNRAKARLERW